MALQDGAALKLLINGAAVTLASSIEHVTEAGIIRIETLEGLAGFSQGSGAKTLQFTYPIMISGHEVPIHRMAALGELVEVQIFEGNESYAGSGKLERAQSSHGVGNAAEATANWTGQLKPPEEF